MPMGEIDNGVKCPKKLLAIGNNGFKSEIPPSLFPIYSLGRFTRQILEDC
jgi:hypothetical protein